MTTEAKNVKFKRQLEQLEKARRSPEKTKQLYEKLRAAKIIVSLRENALRVAPYLYNTERDIDRLLMTLAV